MLSIFSCTWESQFLGRLIRSPGSPRRKKGSGALKVEIRGLEFSRRRKGQTFFSMHFLVLVNYTTRFKLSVQFSSVTQSCPTPCDPMNRSMPGLPVHHQHLQSTQTHIHWVGDAIQPSHTLTSPSLPSIFPSIRVFSNESDLSIRWPKYWSFSFNISSSNEHPGLISFRMDWLDLLAVRGTFKSLLQHHSSKVFILRRSAFLIVQLSHLYMTTGKTIALTRRTFIDKVMSLFNMLTRLVITFLPKSKCLLSSWLQSPSAVILEPRKIKSATVSPSICHEVMGPNAMILVLWMLSFNQLFHSPLSLSSRGPLVLLHFLPHGWCHLHIWGYWYFSQQSWFQLVLPPAQHFLWCSLHISVK